MRLPGSASDGASDGAPDGASDGASDVDDVDDAALLRLPASQTSAAAAAASSPEGIDLPASQESAR